MSFGSRLREARKNAGLTQQELAEKIGTAKSTIAGYEKDAREPNVIKIWEIIKALNVSGEWLLGGTSEQSPFPLSFSEQIHIKKYRALNEHGKSNIDVLLENEFKYSEKPEKILYALTEYLQPASAGSGNWNDDSYSENLKLIKEPPKGTSFIVRVQGNSMEPTFYEEDRLFIKYQPTVEKGDIGIFIINGLAFIKEFDGKHLISHNKAYDPIPLTEEIICQGKVLGICDESYLDKGEW